MNVEHRLTIRARCPIDPGHEDSYDATILVHRVVAVERIHETVATYTAEPIYQEILTECLADALEAKVVTVGEHSGVTTTCEADYHL